LRSAGPSLPTPGISRSMTNCGINIPLLDRGAWQGGARPEFWHNRAAPEGEIGSPTAARGGEL
jgi:hypothetical protein